MKSIKLLSILALFWAIQSCDSNDKSTDPGRTINGTWKLIKVKGGIGGTNDDFTPGTITWDFNSETHTVDVVNLNDDEMKQDLMASGTYDYSFSPNTVTPDTCGEVLVIGGVSYGCYDIETQTLTLSQVESDGLFVTLKR